MAAAAERKETVLTLRVTDQEALAFRLAAKAERVTLSELVRRAVRERAAKTAAEVGPRRTRAA